MVGFVRYYVEKRGCNVFMFDDCVYGYSEGDVIGFGWLDWKDYVDWVYWVINKVGNQIDIVLYGIFMGGVMVFMIGGEFLLDQVKVIVLDCFYILVKDEFMFQFK